ncbi:MAG: DUF3267 domain-containing protein [Bacteroidota bacterium]
MEVRNHALLEALEKKGFAIKDILDHNELIPFVKEIFQNQNLITRSYSGITLSTIVVATALLAYYIVKGELDAFVPFGLGIAVTFLLIPIHEWIHGITYKLLGAKKVSYSAHWKKFYFTAEADQFVVPEQSFYILAFSPFTVISFLCLILMVFFPPYYKLMGAGIFMLHTIFCGGDFGLAAYFYQHKNEELVTFDDVVNKKTYFLSKTSPED